MIVHGPEAVYTGEAGRIISFLGSSKAVAGGTMCRTAVIDMGLRDVIDISKCDMPSVAVSSLGDRIPVIVNHGKTLDSGIAFGDIVAGRLPRNRPVIQVERLSMPDGTVILWESGDHGGVLELAEKIAVQFGLDLMIRRPDIRGVKERDGTVYRQVNGVTPGEPLFIDGHLVGTVSSYQVLLTARNGTIVDVQGVDVKATGLKRAGLIDLHKAMIKSGFLRNSTIRPFICPVSGDYGRIAIIDHSAFSSIESIGPDTICALTVGDDTTEVAGDVLARHGIRIMGITDGDRDTLLADPAKAPGSVVIRVSGITDDDAGAEIGTVVRDMQDTFEGFLKRATGVLDRRKISYTIVRY